MSFPRAVAFFALPTSIVLGACASRAPAPPNAAPRESGQSALMAQTYAGQHKCDPSEHDRPFVVEWDATDISSFQARAADDVVFVKYEGCKLTIVDSCSDDSVRGALGSYKPIAWTTGAIEKVEIENVTDLYAKLPLGVALLGGRVESGEKFHMEYFVSGVRTATRPAVYTADVAKIPGCAGVTHFVYAYNLGAFALGSRSRIKGEVGATVWGAGAGGSSSQASAVDKKAGDIAKCSSDSAKEIDDCKVPIRLTLRSITDGENPDATAARAPETPDALNLAGKMQASNEQQRKAFEHVNSAQTKMNAGDGKGCVAELDQHDKLDSRPEGLSTSPKGMGSLRAICLMMSGQCDAGKQLARKTYDATLGTRLKPEEIDRMIDSQVATYCRAGASSDRDRLLYALGVLQSRQDRRTVAECRAAYDTARRLSPTITPRDNYDMTYDAMTKIRHGAPACFARAGDCATAWQVAKDLDEAYSKSKGDGRSTDRTKRSSFLWATDALCIDKDQGKLTDSEIVFRAIAELDAVRSASPPTASYCTTRVDQGKAALGRVADRERDDDLKYASGYLSENGAKCLALAGDCVAAWNRFSGIERAFTKYDERTIRNRFRDKARACQFKPQGEMKPHEKVFWAAGVLEDATRTRVEATVCTSTYEALKRAADQDDGDHKINSEWNYGTRDVPRNVARCIAKSGDCAAAYKAFADAAPRFSSYPTDAQKLRAVFDSDVSDCKGR